MSYYNEITGKTHKKSVKRDLYVKEIHKLYSEGLNDQEIADVLGISRRTVNHYRGSVLKVPANHVENVYETEQDRIKGYMIRNIKGGSSRRGIEFNLTYKDIPDLPEYCPLIPSLKLTFKGDKGFNESSRATIDRIDSTKGYLPRNVWVISRLANTMKNSATLNQLEEFGRNALLFVENHRALGSITDSESLDF